MGKIFLFLWLSSAKSGERPTWTMSEPFQCRSKRAPRVSCESAWCDYWSSSTGWGVMSHSLEQRNSKILAVWKVGFDRGWKPGGVLMLFWLCLTLFRLGPVRSCPTLDHFSSKNVSCSSIFDGWDAKQMQQSAQHPLPQALCLRWQKRALAQMAVYILSNRPIWWKAKNRGKQDAAECCTILQNVWG